MSGKFSFQEVFGRPYMTPMDAEAANIALDLQREADKRAAKSKS